MPYASPDVRRAKSAEYRAANRAVLALKEKERAARLKRSDPTSFRAKARLAQEKFWSGATEETKQKYLAKGRERGRRSWATVKDDPEIRRRNTDRVASFLRDNLQYRLGHSLRTRLNSALRKRGGIPRNSGAVRALGCSLEFLAGHLQGQFKPGMTWENWKPAGWHIDHIRPLRSFDLTDPAQCAAACHYTNLQPLWAAENIGKGTRYDAALAAMRA